MSGFEIALTVILSVVAMGVTMAMIQVAFLLERIRIRYENEKKPAPKNETDEEK